MRGRYKSKDQCSGSGGSLQNFDGRQEVEVNGLFGGYNSPVTRLAASSSGGTNSPAPGETLTSMDDNRGNAPSTSLTMDSTLTGPKMGNYDSKKHYLGVRVKMPVRDMLRNIRIAKGLDLRDVQGNCGKAKGEKWRVNRNGDLKKSKKKKHTKSLEELAIIVEVLEEDLKTCKTYSTPTYQPLSPEYSPPPQPQSPDYLQEPSNSPWAPEQPLHSYMLKHNHENKMQKAQNYDFPDFTLPSPSDKHSVHSINSQGYNSDESDDMIPSPQSCMSYSPSGSEYQVPSSPDSVFASSQPQVYEFGQDRGRECQGWNSHPRQEGGRDAQGWNSHLKEDRGSNDEDWNSAAFFWTQLQREESILREVSDAELLVPDKNGRTALHRVVSQGKRALGYVIARRMAALNKLDLKDSEGKTALHLAAQKNQHLMVSDLIRLGARVNETDKLGKTCLHLSAEKGYIRVLEVLINMMRNGVYVDVETTDHYGLSVLQCAAVALNSTVRELERSVSPSQSRLYTLRKEQMMETLVCVLQMGTYLHKLDHGCGESYKFSHAGSSKPVINKGDYMT